MMWLFSFGLEEAEIISATAAEDEKNYDDKSTSVITVTVPSSKYTAIVSIAT